jgi:hypothetical protein
MTADESAEAPGPVRRDPGRRIQRRRRVIRRRDPRLPYPVAAGAVGLVVAVMARGLVFGGERACDLVRGTSTCGSLGGFLLALIAAAMLYVGTRLLRFLAVPEPGITSVLGTALLAIAVLTVLLDEIFSAWMWVVLPVVAALVYAFAAWASTTLSELGKS